MPCVSIIRDPISPLSQTLPPATNPGTSSGSRKLTNLPVPKTTAPSAMASQPSATPQPMLPRNIFIKFGFSVFIFNSVYYCIKYSLFNQQFPMIFISAKSNASKFTIFTLYQCRSLRMPSSRPPPPQ